MSGPQITSEERRWFDEQFELVLAELPERVKQLIEEVPLVVEDHPSRKVMEEMGVEHPEDLCGLYTGVPLTEPASREFRRHADQIMIYRAGVFGMAADDEGYADDDALRREIRITILHEMGHHHGLDEEDLRQLGYG